MNFFSRLLGGLIDSHEEYLKNKKKLIEELIFYCESLLMKDRSYYIKQMGILHIMKDDDSKDLELEELMEELYERSQ